ncbi:hypothetical protein LQ384_27555 [Rhodococcus rhodochrous]|uniref:Transposase n=1 Tax=Rhodococcus rhodochrous TaxID=1829 RepID=A0AAW4XPC1_RHORH|nr:hypothetical protein [Rhodococcus rhodochrous]MCD2114858.1 hypothetical protein [Rhodococcus rhodochrous]
MTTPSTTVTVIGGVDNQGRLLGRKELPANNIGYQSLSAWLHTRGTEQTIGVESVGVLWCRTHSLSHLSNEAMIEVNQPNRAA